MLDIFELSLVSTIFCEWSAAPPGLPRIISKWHKEQPGTACHSVLRGLYHV